VKTLTTAVVIKEYVKKRRSFNDIAVEYSTYPNKIKRMLLKAGHKPRDKSDAQKQALKSGRSKHPTEGRERTVEERLKISEAVAQDWAEASEEVKTARSEASKAQWARMSQVERETLLKKARDAARNTVKDGSRLEKVMRDALRAKGFKVEFHYDALLENPKLQLDLYLPELSTAIEIDGPSHFEPIWGEENFHRNLRADLAKTGLLLAHGIVIIRVKNRSRHISNKIERSMTTQVLAAVASIQKKRPKQTDSLIEIEV